MKTLRIFALTSLVAGFGLMTGCDTTDSSAPQITEFESANFNEASSVWSKGLELEFYGKATDDNSVTKLTLDVVNSTGTSVYTLSRTASGTSVKFGTGETVKFNILNPGTWGPSGTYTVRLTVVDNDGLTAIKTQTVKYLEGTGTAPVVTGTPLTEVDSYEDGTFIIAGTQGSTYTSFLSIKDAMTYTTGTIDDWSVIDLIFFASASGTPTLYSPAEAKTQGLGNLAAAPVVSTKIWKTSKTYEEVSTAQDLAAAITAAKAAGSVATSAAAVEGGVYLVELSDGKQAILKVTSLKDNGKTSTGKYNINITLKWSDNI